MSITNNISKVNNIFEDLESFSEILEWSLDI